MTVKQVETIAELLHLLTVSLIGGCAILMGWHGLSWKRRLVGKTELTQSLLVIIISLLVSHWLITH